MKVILMLFIIQINAPDYDIVAKAFMSNSSVTSIVVLEGVTGAGMQMFSSCVHHLPI